MLLAMDADTEKDDEIFFYCDSLNDMKSMADKGRGRFHHSRVYRFRNIRRTIINPIKSCYENQMSGTLR